MQESFLINQLLTIEKQKLISFHVPGHKNGSIYHKFPYENYVNLLANIDTTEIPGTDNLHYPKGVIDKAQKRASEFLGSEETFFLVNGSTSGIYSMIMAVTQPGDKVIVARNCHASVTNALVLGDCVPVYMYPEMDLQHGIALNITPDEVERVLQSNLDTKAVILTSPTYHGVVSNLKKIAEIVHKYDKILLIDEAHGAHLGLSDKLPLSALACGADVVVQSTHKTLPAFTQGAMLHLQGDRVDRERLKFMLRLHQSSSPSYILLSSLDFAMEIYQKEGKQLMEALLENIGTFRKRIKQYEGVYLLEEEVDTKGSSYLLDTTKLWINAYQLGLRGVDMEKELRGNYGIQMELANLYGTLAVSTIGNNAADFIQLGNAIEKLIEKERKNSLPSYPTFRKMTPKIYMAPREALYKERSTVLLDDADGEISSTTLIPYPPGIPLLMPGEIIDKEMINHIKVIIEAGIEIIGLHQENGLIMIDVIKN